MATAFISVSNKSGLANLAQALINLGIDLIASQGSANFLSEKGLEVLSIEAYLKLSPGLDGRVKTLHPGLFSGILADRKNPKHLEELQANEVRPIDFVIVDLYPFSSFQDREHIDIGGVALIRAAAKNYEFCTVLSDTADYPILLEALTASGLETSLAFRKMMAARAFKKTAHYDAQISSWCGAEDFKLLSLERNLSLAYGENPHQSAAFYTLPEHSANIKQLQGKSLSYNNLLDLDAGLRLISEFEAPAAAIIKHTNPCGVALGSNIDEALQAAFYADEKSAFGGIVVLNQVADAKTAEFLNAGFFELIAARDFTQAALDSFAEKNNRRLLRFNPYQPAFEIRSALNGFLIQTPDFHLLDLEQCAIPTLEKPDKTLYSDLRFAFQVVRHLKSNAVVIVKNGVTLAIGLGQTNRVDAVRHALARTKTQDLRNAVLASDGFFPFEDSIEQIAATGIKTIIQPGGSRQDQKIIDACNKYQISMMMTSLRVFKH